jgi:hypothetical protein
MAAVRIQIRQSLDKLRRKISVEKKLQVENVPPDDPEPGMGCPERCPGITPIRARSTMFKPAMEPHYNFFYTDIFVGLITRRSYTFDDLVAGRDIPRHYTEDDLKLDLAYAHGQ